ncbi:hypothetical protein FAES_3819 [Fibrella aestuarina BUZ 2]|uniref:Uncharacterized protein n=1 Tax=Fibrella aestuarina BUZ 2 TaxID=1166018 RepID=I0KCH3_9BACT|nr:hypothetical protein [Fibrella aestuarina]CCH01826.1 hypothetical protein FAES_3819 [Fibrella aestuarina BUZ 2]
MYTISSWAGKNPWLIRLFILPVLFYVQGKIAFAAGADLFFYGFSAADFWFWGLIGVIWLAAYLYPHDARAQLKTNFWVVKRLELLSCTAVFGLWMFAGNQMAQHVEGKAPLSKTDPVRMASVSHTKSDSESRTKIETKEQNRVKRAYRAYFRNAIKRIKKDHQTKHWFTVVISILAGVVLIGLGIIMLVCGIQCSGSGGMVALGVIGGLGLVGLGIWVLIAGIRRRPQAG